MAIFTILYGNYYPSHGEFELICIGKISRRTWVNFTQQYGKNCQRCQQNTHYYAVWQLLLYFYREFVAIFTTLSVVIWFSTGTVGIFATLVYVFTMRVIIYDILSMAIITTLSTSILFCNLYYILLWISPRSVVKIAIWI